MLCPVVRLGLCKGIFDGIEGSDDFGMLCLGEVVYEFVVIDAFRGRTFACASPLCAVHVEVVALTEIVVAKQLLRTAGASYAKHRHRDKNNDKNQRI